MGIDLAEQRERMQRIKKVADNCRRQVGVFHPSIIEDLVDLIDVEYEEVMGGLMELPVDKRV